MMRSKRVAQRVHALRMKMKLVRSIMKPSVNRLQKGRAHMQFIVNFDAESAIPGLVKTKAEEEGITPEMLIKRAISGYLGTYGNVEPQEPQKATSLREFFQDRGLINKT